jgi:hypothetical protein
MESKSGSDPGTLDGVGLHKVGLNGGNIARSGGVGGRPRRCGGMTLPAPGWPVPLVPVLLGEISARPPGGMVPFPWVPKAASPVAAVPPAPTSLWRCTSRPAALGGRAPRLLPPWAGRCVALAGQLGLLERSASADSTLPLGSTPSCQKPPIIKRFMAFLPISRSYHRVDCPS